MNCLGEYQYKNTQKELAHFPLGIEEDISIKRLEYYLPIECESHENCTKCSVRGIPFHGNSLDMKAMVFVGDEIIACEHPLFYSYENPPSKGVKQYDFEDDFELLDIVCFYSLFNLLFIVD